jgi:2-succinyl-6-hydroxy-2,4-cyclohexadiene-1-carboxylate synthase
VRVRQVHGFTHTALAWEPVTARLPRDWDVQALEVPDGLDFVSTAEALGRRGGPGTWMGYSMGARLGLRLALDRPDLVERLVLVSGTAGIASPAERATRRAADERLAGDVERDGVEAFLNRWLSQRLFESLPRERAMLDDRRRGNSVHRIAHQLRALGQAAQDPLWDRLGELAAPTLLIVGAYDRTYIDAAGRLADGIRDATVVTIAKAGHAVHLERPEEVAGAVVTWLADVTPGAEDPATEDPADDRAE